MVSRPGVVGLFFPRGLFEPCFEILGWTGFYFCVKSNLFLRGFCWLNFQSVKSLPYFLLNSPVWWLTPLFFHHFWWWNHFQWLRHQGVHPSGGVFDVPTVPTVVPTVIPRRRPRCTSTFTAPCVSCCPRCCRASMPRCSATSPRCGGRCSARRRDVWDAMGWMVRDGGNMWESYREI